MKCKCFPEKNKQKTPRKFITARMKRDEKPKSEKNKTKKTGKLNHHHNNKEFFFGGRGYTLDTTISLDKETKSKN